MNIEELEGSYNKFTEVVDPFNPQNKLSGHIGISNINYGNLIITEINGEECEQTIYTTPKLSYPFDRNGKWTLPPARYIEVYEKLDGTNIFMYRYRYQDEWLVTYKTRLTPFVVNGYFGEFQDMWREMLEKYPDIATMFDRHSGYYGFAFELYGSRNKHLMEYDVPLDTALLFGVSSNIRPGDNINYDINSPADMGAGPYSFDPHRSPNIYEENIPAAPKIMELTNSNALDELKKDFEPDYRLHQNNMETTLVKSEEDGVDSFEGSEGYVWYVCLEDWTIKMFKCKPESIENIHWEMGSPMINQNTIRSPVYNSAESGGISVLKVEELLREEFSKEKVEKSRARIDKVYREVRQELQMRKKVQERLADINYKNMEVPDVMRYLSNYFVGSEMSKVYGNVMAIRGKE